MQGKTLHIVRHGKALQEFIQIQDDDRPLTANGVLNNMIVAKKFVERYPVPDLIISSYAARALQTAHIFARVMHFPHEKVKASEELYLHGDKEIYRILDNLPDEIESVMIVGHNPDLTYVANRFSPRIGEISTSSVVTVIFETKRWSDFHEVKTKCSFLDKKDFIN